MTASTAANPTAQAQQQFFAQLEQLWQIPPIPDIQRLILSQFKRADNKSADNSVNHADIFNESFNESSIQDLQKIILRPIQLKGQWVLNAVWRYRTKDITKNYTWSEFVTLWQQGQAYFQQVNVFTASHDLQLKCKKGQWHFSQSRLKNPVQQQAASSTHNRSKPRFVTQDSAFLQHLGVTDRQHNIIPSMARKWKQINKFVEIFADTLQEADLAQSQQPLYVADFGAGKGYLTFAIYDYVQQNGMVPHVTGIELRPELAQFCQQTAERVGFPRLQFFQGDVRSFVPERTDVMIALHACDIATDYAIFSGIQLDARVIMCAPCCHKEIRPQLTAPSLLKPMLIHGIQATQYAEMLTDSIRALLLSAYGYQCKIIEFISLEHTGKNKMILAVKKQATSAPNRTILAEVEALQAAHGIQRQTLQQLLQDELQDEPQSGRQNS